MAYWGDYGYLEGDERGKTYDLRLMGRIARFARGRGMVILAAAVLVVFATGLDLLLPWITRVAIDRYMVRQAVHVERVKAPDLAMRLVEAAGPEALPGSGGDIYLAEQVWRKLDPALTGALRQAGAVDATPWYLGWPGEQGDVLTRELPGAAVEAGGRVLVPAPVLAQTPGDLLWRLRAPDVWGLIWMALAFLVASAASFWFNFGQTMLLERTGQGMMLAIRQRLFAHLISRRVAFLRQNPVGKLVTRLTNDVNNLNELFRTTLVALLQDFFLLVGITVAILIMDLKLALVSLSLAPVVALITWLFARWARDAFRRMQQQLGRINARFAETLSGLAVIKLFNAEARGSREFQSLNAEHFKASMGQVKVFTFFMPLTELVGGLVMALIIWYGGGQVLRDRLSLGTLVAFITYMQMFFRPIRDLAEKYNVLQAAMASGERIFNLMDQGEALPEPLEPRPAAQPGPGRVEFAGVTFGYDPAKPVVRGVDFAIPAGQTWAVVGPTGAGKSSLVNLLLRLYDPNQGEVRIDGLALTHFSEEDLARRVSLVSQEVFLLAGSVAENVTLERPGVNRAAVARSLAISGADHFVAQLPQGLDTQLGEGARKLSFGEKQLLALARAVAGDPAILVMDEATSGVDPVSERRIQEALPRVMAGRTTLVVAHRLSTIRNADNILVMKGGQVVEQGRHAELMAAQGFYYRLARLQEMGEEGQAG